MSTQRFFALALAALISVYAMPSIGAEPGHDMNAAPSKQTRRDMADAFEKATVCLRSDRPFDECRTLIAMASAGMQGKQCMMMDHGAGMPSKPDAAKHDH